MISSMKKEKRSEGFIISDKFEAGNNFRRFDVPLQDLRVNLKDDLLIAGIIRDEELITPTGQDVIKEGDSVIIVTLEEGFDNLNDILNF